MRRFVWIIVGLLATVLIAVSVFAFVTVRRSFPATSGSVTLSGLTNDVEIVRGEFGIPQIYATNSADLFFGQGYAHAQDRFFEMDFRRHVTSGRLTELFGRSALETDKFVRTLGWRRVAEQEVAALDAQTMELLEAYAAGVNAYIDGKSGGELSLEYALLSLTGPDYRPEPWEPADSVAWIKAMAWSLASNMGDEITRVLSTENLERSEVEELYPGYPYEIHQPIVGSGRVIGGEFTQLRAPVGLPRTAVAALKNARDAIDAMPTLLGSGPGIGSNSWVVSGERTTTGMPILANDPHLAPSMPGIWYEAGLHCVELSKECPYDVSGFTFSGMPGVVVGHNRKIAWGVTTMYADVADLYLERISGTTYEYDGKQVPLETRRESFTIAGEEDPVSITVRSTRHGPVISDVDDAAAEVAREGRIGGLARANAVSLSWTALTPQPTIKAVFALGKAQNWSDFRAAAELFTVPSQNLVYADVEGNIGYQAPGIIPIRGKGDGRWPAAGWDPAYEWVGAIPFDELPRLFNPPSGMIVTANQQVIGPQYQPLLGADTAPGYRSDRIGDLLSRDEKLSVADMGRIQLDTYNANAAQLVPYLLDVTLDSDYYRQGQDTLRGWDFMQPADSAAAAYFNAVWRDVLKLTFHDELPEDVRPSGGGRWFNVMRTILDRPTSHWWDDVSTPSQTESRNEILANAMRDARDELTSMQSREPSRWSWGQFHRLTLVNETLGSSGIGFVESLFNRGPYEVAGGGGTILANAWDATEGYAVTAVPSMRMTVDMSDLDNSRWIQLTGNSGHAFHDNYTDQTELWLKGKSLPWAFSRDAVEQVATDTLVLEPAGN